MIIFFIPYQVTRSKIACLTRIGKKVKYLLFFLHIIFNYLFLSLTFVYNYLSQNRKYLTKFFV